MQNLQNKDKSEFSLAYGVYNNINADEIIEELKNKSKFTGQMF